MPPHALDNPLVDTPEFLGEFCEFLSAHDQVGIDTEFTRVDTYVPELGLVQLGAGDRVACVDPLAGLDLEPLWDILLSPSTLQILHAAKQDFEVILATADRLPQRLFDTQIAAGLLGHPAQIGYAALVKELLGVELHKGETRTDWSRRPLSDAQLRYAVDDVVYLPQLYAILREQLEQRGRLDWALEDSLALINPQLYAAEPEDAWQRIKSIPHLPATPQLRARRLAAWRERRAIDRNRPRQWILADRALLQIAGSKSPDLDSLRRLDDVPAAVVRNQGHELLKILQKSDRDLAAGHADSLKAPVEIDRALVRRLVDRVRERAKELGMASEVLASRKDISAILRGDADARALSGWRLATIGRELQELAG